MILTIQNIRQCSILLIFIVSLIIETNTEWLDNDFDEHVDESISMKNKSLADNFTTNIINSTIQSVSSSSIEKSFSSKHGLLNKLIHSKNSTFFKKRLNISSLSTVSNNLFSTVTTRNNTFLTAQPVPIYVIINYLLNQFNKYRDVDIISRIKQCDPKMKLNEMCETYSVDNHSYSLIRESNVEFHSLKQLYDGLIDRIAVYKLNRMCSIDHWCLANLTQDDFHFTLDVLRQRGRSLCTLERCAHRLSVHATSCPSISPKNISTPTLKLLPMLCALYNEQERWNTPECINDIVYLLHTLYAFWPKLETCYHAITDGSGGCQSECLMFDSIFHQAENRCNQFSSFFSRVPALAWYRLINLKQICRHGVNSSRSGFVSSVENLISSNFLWYRLHQRPVVAILFIMGIISIVISFSFCLYMMSKNDSNSRRLDDNYEYTRLHDSTFDITPQTDNTNINLSSTRIMNESQFDSNGHQRISEHQRLLYNES